MSSFEGAAPLPVALGDQDDAYMADVLINRVHSHIVAKNDEPMLADLAAGMWKTREPLADKGFKFIDEARSAIGIVGRDEFENLKQIVARRFRELDCEGHRPDFVAISRTLARRLSKNASSATTTRPALMSSSARLRRLRKYSTSSFFIFSAIAS